MSNNGLIEVNDLTPGQSATAYMRLGLHVLPCKPLSKQPATRHGFFDAIVDPPADLSLDDVAEVYNKAGHNVAIRTGLTIDVLDVDVKGGQPGLQSLQAISAAGLLRGAVAQARTPSGGLHLYFPASGARNGSIATAGLDHRGDGGYVLAAGSRITVQGGVATYRWLFSRDLSDGEPLDWDAVRLTVGPNHSRHWVSIQGGQGGIASLLAWVARLPQGNRNNGLYWAAHRALELGLDPRHLTIAALKSGLVRPEAEATIHSAIRAHRDY